MMSTGQGSCAQTARIVAASLHSTNLPDETSGVAALPLGDEQPYLALADAALGFWDWHIPSGRDRFSRRWCQMLGFEPDEIAHDVASWEQRVHPDDIDRVLTAWSAHVEGRTEVYETEHRLRHRNGHWIWILDRGRVIERTADGAPLRAVGTHLDISERKAGEQRLRDALRELELRNRALTASGEGIVIGAPDHRIVFANAGFSAITGYSAAEIIGRSCSLLQGPETDPCTMADLAAALREYRTFRGEILNYRKDGSRFWNELAITPVFDDDALPTHFVGVLRDVTERRNVQEERDQALSRLQQIASRFPGIVYQFRLEADGSWSFPYMSARLEEYFGIQAHGAGIDAARVLAAVHPDDRAGIETSTRASAATLTPWRCEFRVARPDGTPRWLLGSGIPEQEADGAVLWHGVIADISERKEADDRLRDSELFNRAVLDSLTAHIAVLDAEGAIVAVNAAWRRFAQANAAPDAVVRSVGQSYRDICLGAPRYPDGDEAGAAWTGIAGVLARRHSRFSLEYPCHSPTEQRWFRMNVHPLQGPREGAVVAHEDITAVKANEARLIALSHRLAMADEQARRRLSAELHDRTSSNLTALRINLDLVSAALDADRAPELVDPIDDARALIDDTASSLREIGSELRPPLLDYAGVHAALESYVEQFTRRTGVVVELTCDDRAIRLDPEREALLFRIVQEALTNCAKHARATSVKIELALERNPVSLDVADDGVGFDPEALGSPGAGCGLGLLNMRSMAEVAGGRFVIETRRGAGTHIRVEV